MSEVMQNNILNFDFHLQTNTLLNPFTDERMLNSKIINNPDVASGLHTRYVYGGGYSANFSRTKLCLSSTSLPNGGVNCEL